MKKAKPAQHSKVNFSDNRWMTCKPSHKMTEKELEIYFEQKNKEIAGSRQGLGE